MLLWFFVRVLVMIMATVTVMAVIMLSMLGTGLDPAGGSALPRRFEHVPAMLSSAVALRDWSVFCLLVFPHAACDVIARHCTEIRCFDLEAG